MSRSRTGTGAAARPVLVAPDSFKGTFSAAEVAAAVGRGLAAVGLPSDLCPLADGGEGTAAVLRDALGGHPVEVATTDPLGRPVAGEILLLADSGRAVVETASASGLSRLADGELDPWAASTWGTGLLIRAAVEAGAREILVAAGGSATVDGGCGAVAAIRAGGGLGGAALLVLCDVRTRWEDCARVYGPQKGADPGTVRRLSARLDEYAARLPRDPRGRPLGGAAGGLSGGLWGAFGARLVSGAAYVLDVVDFDARSRRARCVITGEGRLDAQSRSGKVVGEVAGRAARAQIPWHAVVGAAELTGAERAALGARSVIEAGTLRGLEAAGRRIGAELLAGRRSG